MENNMEKYEIEHIRRVRELSSECTLFLKRNGDFPLDKPCKVALYGNAARKTIKGGTGSGDVNVRHYVGIEEGLENAGFTVTSKKWLDSYEHLFAECEKKHREDIKQKILTEGISAIMLGVEFGNSKISPFIYSGNLLSKKIFTGDFLNVDIFSISS